VYQGATAIVAIVYRPLTNSLPEQTPFDPLSASNFVDVALGQIAPTFGKLAFLAGLRRENSGRYDDPLAALVYGKDQVDAVLRKKHREIFHVWLGVALVAQTEEVAEYLAVQADGQNPRIAQLLQRWIQYKLYVNLIPEDMSEPAREMFSSDLRAILQLLQVRLGSIAEA
jgi:hypothetical protein